MPQASGFAFGPRFKKGQELTADDLNKLQDAIQAARPIAGVGVRSKPTPQGVVLSVDARSGGSASTPPHPYKGFDASSGATPMVRIEPGTHSNVWPTIDGIPINEQDEDGNYPLLTLGGSALIVYVQLNTDSAGTPTSASIHSSNDPTPPTDDATTAYQTLFGVAVTIEEDVASVTINQSVSGSQNHERVRNWYVLTSDPSAYTHRVWLV